MQDDNSTCDLIMTLVTDSHRRTLLQNNFYFNKLL